MENESYDGEEVYIKESSFNHISPCIIAKTIQVMGQNARVYLDMDGLPLEQIFIGQAPELVFLGHYSHNYSPGKGHTSRIDVYPISSVINDLQFIRERFPETGLVTIAAPDEYKKFMKNGAQKNICRRHHTNLDLEIATLAAEFLSKSKSS